jgi:hypothetical protein
LPGSFPEQRGVEGLRHFAVAGFVHMGAVDGVLQAGRFVEPP